MSPQELRRFPDQRLRDQTALPRARMTPDLAYGRHRGPVPGGFPNGCGRRCPVSRSAQGWTLPLTLRPLHLATSRRTGLSARGTNRARRKMLIGPRLREFEEELGIAPRWYIPLWRVDRRSTSTPAQPGPPGRDDHGCPLPALVARSIRGSRGDLPAAARSARSRSSHKPDQATGRDQSELKRSIVWSFAPLRLSTGIT